MPGGLGEVAGVAAIGVRGGSAASAVAKHWSRLRQRRRPEGWEEVSGASSKESQTSLRPRWLSQPSRTPRSTAQQSAFNSLSPTWWWPHSWWNTKSRTIAGCSLSMRGLRISTPGAAAPSLGSRRSMTTSTLAQRTVRPAELDGAALGPLRVRRRRLASASEGRKTGTNDGRGQHGAG